MAHDTQTIGQNFQVEKSAAMALPAHPFDACIQRSGAIDKYQTVVFETNRYSVPHTSAFAKVTIKAYVDRVMIVHKGAVVAEHRRGYGRRESFIDPVHFVAALARKPAWLDHVPALRDWALPQSFERLRTKLKELHGPRTGDRHYIRVLQLLLRHPAARLGRAITMSLHRPTLTAELIGQLADRLTDGGHDAASIDMTQQSDAVRRLQVPMPDLRRFNRLLSSHSPEGEQTHEYNDDELAAAVDAAAASPQDAEAADDAGRVCEARA